MAAGSVTSQLPVSTNAATQVIKPPAMPSALKVPAPLTAKDLEVVHESRHKQVIGEHLSKLIQPLQPGSAGKITGMLLELDNDVLFGLLADPAALEGKVDEALQTLQDFAAQQGSWVAAGPVLSGESSSIISDTLGVGSAGGSSVPS